MSFYQRRLAELTTSLANERSALDPLEIKWKQKDVLLQGHGYSLCAPQTDQGNRSGSESKVFQDAMLHHENTIDAVRMSDGLDVSIRRVYTDGEELKILDQLVTDSCRDRSYNPCIAPIDRFPDEEQVNITYIVIPRLVNMDENTLNTVADAMIFLEQLLECLEFMHRKRVVHRDIRVENIMFNDCNEVTDMGPPSRRYYIIDSGLSVQLKPARPVPNRRVEYHRVLGPTDRVQDIPEVSFTALTDPFSSDMYMVRNIIESTIMTRFKNAPGQFYTILRFFHHENPARRNESWDVLANWRYLHSKVTPIDALWHLQPVNDVWMCRLARSLNTMLIAREIFGTQNVLQYLCNLVMRSTKSLGKPSLHTFLFVFTGALAVTASGLRAVSFAINRQ